MEKITLLFENVMQKFQKKDKQLTVMRNLFTILANKIYKLEIWNSNDANFFLNLNLQFSTFIDQVPFLDVSIIVDSDMDILFNWLMKPLTDGKQKILRYYRMNQRREMELRFINRIKEVQY